MKEESRSKVSDSNHVYYTINSGQSDQNNSLNIYVIGVHLAVVIIETPIYKKSNNNPGKGRVQIITETINCITKIW